MTAGKPTSHPFNMYTHILDQPEAVAEVLERNQAVTSAAATDLAECERLFLVGIGTSYHATLAVDHFMREWAGRAPVFPVHSFDFVLYGPELTERDGVIIISHKGTKSYSVGAMEKAEAAGATIVLITGRGLEGKPTGATHTLETVPVEQSATYTISYTTALALMADLAVEVGAAREQEPALARRVVAEELPAAMRSGLESDGQMREWASRASDRRRIWLVGGGPGAIVAQETALKIKEATYLQAEGISVEQILHGGVQCVEPEDIFVLIAQSGPSLGRMRQFAAGMRELGAPMLVLSDGSSNDIGANAENSCDIMAVPEPLTSITCQVPLQLFSYYLALEQGTHPDTFRLDDERFARAFQVVSLYEQA